MRGCTDRKQGLFCSGLEAASACVAWAGPYVRSCEIKNIARAVVGVGFIESTPSVVITSVFVVAKTNYVKQRDKRSTHQTISVLHAPAAFQQPFLLKNEPRQMSSTSSKLTGVILGGISSPKRFMFFATCIIAKKETATYKVL